MGAGSDGRWYVSVSISKAGWKPVTGLSGDGFAVIERGQFILYDHNREVVAEAPLASVRAYYTRWLFRSSVTVWVGGERYLIGRGGGPSSEQLHQYGFAMAAGTTPAGASLRGLLDAREFARNFARAFQAAGGTWSRPRT